MKLTDKQMDNILDKTIRGIKIGIAVGAAVGVGILMCFIITRQASKNFITSLDSYKLIYDEGDGQERILTYSKN